MILKKEKNVFTLEDYPRWQRIALYAVLLGSVIATLCAHLGMLRVERNTVHDLGVFAICLFVVSLFRGGAKVVIDAAHGSLRYETQSFFRRQKGECANSWVTALHLNYESGGRMPGTYVLTLSTGSHAPRSIKMRGEMNRKRAVRIFEELKAIFPQAASNLPAYLANKKAT